MPFVSRVGDMTVAQGRILLGAATVTVEGRPLGLHVSPISPHPKGKPHAVAKTVMGSKTVQAEFRPVLYTGCMTTCGHPILTGARTVTIGL
jgi:uncharacterized Zn-binding protein involved in type VI secretion